MLYAPTFRDNELDHFQLHLDLEEMQHHLNGDYIVLLRLHPAVKNNLDISKYDGFVYDYSKYAKLNDILFITDILITDYSSIPFDFSILGKPMIFFPYDLEHYQKERGFWGEYSDVVPGPIAMSTSEIITILQSGDFQLEEISEYENKWNEYSKGASSQNIASWILYTLKSQETKKSSLYET
nr:CDP-glycerol glycerophosphotransferase family protein [Cytobacillus pseudoceanisediminis]